MAGRFTFVRIKCRGRASTTSTRRIPSSTRFFEIDDFDVAPQVSSIGGRRRRAAADAAK
jgi:hypothetical protein